MTRVNVREFRHRLSEYIERAEAGESLEVTVHGRPVGRFVPMDPSATTLQRLIAEGKVTPAADPDTTTLPERQPARGGGLTATEELLLERWTDFR